MRQRRQGIALLEFALWLLPIITLLTGIVEVSRMLSIQHVVARAARDGARIGAGMTRAPAPATGVATQSDIETAAIDHATNVLNDTGYTCDVDCVVTATWYANNSGRMMLMVEVQYPFTPILGLVPGWNRPLVRNFTMMTQQQ